MKPIKHELIFTWETETTQKFTKGQKYRFTQGKEYWSTTNDQGEESGLVLLSKLMDNQYGFRLCPNSLYPHPFKIITLTKRVPGFTVGEDYLFHQDAQQLDLWHSFDENL